MSDRFKVVLVANDNHPIPEWVATKMADAGIDYSYHQCYTREDLQKYAADADVAWYMSSRKGLVVEENMDVFTKLGMAIKCGSGTENIDHAACTKRGIIVGHTPDDPTEPTSDHAIALLLTSIRRTARQDWLVRQGTWAATEALPIGHMTGADLGLLGFGRIGKTIIRKLSGFRMNIRVFDPYIEAAAIEAVGCKKTDLDELVRESQLILVCCPLNDETRGIIGEKQLRMMRKGAILVNAARGGLVDEDALLKALTEKWITAAATDVVASPPLKPDHPLLQLDNFNLTPHLGGYPDQYPDKLFAAVVDVIIGASKTRTVPWVANRGVNPWWQPVEAAIK